jgi:hypothetical protein
MPEQTRADGYGDTPGGVGVVINGPEAEHRPEVDTA